MTTTLSPRMRALHDAYQALGYRTGPAPAWLKAAVAIDREVCQEGACDGCGRPGLRLVPYFRPGSYAAVACCPACGHAVAPPAPGKTPSAEDDYPEPAPVKNDRAPWFSDDPAPEWPDRAGALQTVEGACPAGTLDQADGDQADDGHWQHFLRHNAPPDGEKEVLTGVPIAGDEPPPEPPPPSRNGKRRKPQRT